MKKIFCDICNSEFEYSDWRCQKTSGKEDVVAYPSGHSLDIKIRVHGNPKNGEHMDICGKCRVSLVKDYLNI